MSVDLDDPKSYSLWVRGSLLSGVVLLGTTIAWLLVALITWDASTFYTSFLFASLGFFSLGFCGRRARVEAERMKKLNPTDQTDDSMDE